MNRAGITVLAAVAFIGIAWASAGVSAESSKDNGSGYFWTDSKAPDPRVEFDWIDISKSGTPVTELDDQDDDALVVPIGFSFEYFGEMYTQLDLSTNGMLSFDIIDAGECNDNYNWGYENDDSDYLFGWPIPHESPGDCEEDDDGWGSNPLIAVWFDDIDPEECGEIFTETRGAEPGRMFVVQWNSVCHNLCEVCEATESVTFEAILFEGSGEIKFQYLDTFFGDTKTKKDIGRNNYGGTATIGLNKDGETGLQYLWNTPSLVDELAVLFTTAPFGTRLQGDVDCDDDVDTVDALFELRDVAELPVNQPKDCPGIGTAGVMFGDVDCDDDVDAVDALFVLRHVAALPVNVPKGCTPIGEPL